MGYDGGSSPSRTLATAASVGALAMVATVCGANEGNMTTDWITSLQLFGFGIWIAGLTILAVVLTRRVMELLDRCHRLECLIAKLANGRGRWIEGRPVSAKEFEDIIRKESETR
jgi:hypothetical protein